MNATWKPAFSPETRTLSSLAVQSQVNSWVKWARSKGPPTNRGEVEVPAVGEVELDEAVELFGHSLQLHQGLKRNVRQNYPRLNALMETFGHLNFTVLGFCCNQFGLQSPEVNHETMNVLKYVRPGGGFVPKFPIFGRVEVNGLNEEPLFTFLKESLPFVNPVIGDIKKFYWSPLKVNDIRWNFEKFLIAADGAPYRRFDLHCPMENVERDIARLLA